MKKYLIYGAVFTALAFVAGGPIGIGIALLGGLLVNFSYYKNSKESAKILEGEIADLDNQLSVREAQAENHKNALKKYEAMIDRLQIDCSHKDDVIRGYQQKESEAKKLDEAIQELPVAKEPRKKATKKTK